MEGVHDVLVRLEPVAVHERWPSRADALAVRYHLVAGLEVLEHVVAGEHGLLVGRAEVREDHAVALLHRIPRLAVAVAV